MFVYNFVIKVTNINKYKPNRDDVTFDTSVEIEIDVHSYINFEMKVKIGYHP